MKLEWYFGIMADCGSRVNFRELQIFFIQIRFIIFRVKYIGLDLMSMK